MRAFLDYLSSGNADSNLTHRIEEKILEAKRNSGWKVDFMDSLDKNNSNNQFLK